MIRAYAIVGASGSGKTGLIKKLIRILTQRGFKVGAAKHTHHDFEIDYPGKDSFKMKLAGAGTVALVSAHRVALVMDTDTETPVQELLKAHFESCDFILLEGFRSTHLPKILLIQKALPVAERTPYSKLANVEAVVTDDPPPSYPNARRFSWGQVEAIADFLQQQGSG
ncbi:MAG: molybdopterin-guanine dinucleotide biosynthesis protein B [Acidobacteriota bacterium]